MSTKSINRLSLMVEKAHAVLSTHRPSPPHVIGFPTLDSGAFEGWKAQAIACLISIFGESHIYTQSFKKKIERAYQSTVEAGIGILTAAKEDLEAGLEDEELEESAKDDFAGYELHKRISEVVGTKYQDGHYAEAVESAFKEVIKRVKDYVNSRSSPKVDGAKAMGRAFDFDHQEPLVKFNDLKSDEEKDEHRGIAFLFKGIVFIRNRKAHENITLEDPARAKEYLALASLLMRLLDEFAK